jgi:hypothetical protein
MQHIGRNRFSWWFEKDRNYHDAMKYNLIAKQIEACV